MAMDAASENETHSSIPAESSDSPQSEKGSQSFPSVDEDYHNVQ